MTRFQSSVRSLTLALAVVASTGAAYAAGDFGAINQGVAATSALPGTTAPVAPCGPGAVKSPLGY